LVVIAAVALAVGSGRSSAPTLAQRAATIESRIRCPSCEDISVAQSEAPLAIQARRQIVAMLKAGSSDAAIEQSFVGRFGPSILLSPAGSNLDVVVWVLPLTGALVALGALAVVFWRRQRMLSRLRGSS
jgi:cytochrome c-type biogenesis protein CcmH